MIAKTDADTASFETQVAVLAALAQDTRLRIVGLVAAAGERGIAAGNIGRTVHCPPSTLSFHLKELSRSGVLEAKPSGRFVIYGLRREVLGRLAEFLAVLGGLPAVRRGAAPPVGRRRRGRARGATGTDQLTMFSE